MFIRALLGGTLYGSLSGILPVLLPLLMWYPVLSEAQETPESSLVFFEQRAYADAVYEHEMEWKSEEDGVDYWSDQRNFEEALEKNDHQAYQVYLHSKRAAYIAHRDKCTSETSHGEYYQLHAAFYYQYGGPEYSGDLYIATTTAH
jgi:hypothetical protein